MKGGDSTKSRDHQPAIESMVFQLWLTSRFFKRLTLEATYSLVGNGGLKNNETLSPRL